MLHEILEEKKKELNKCILYNQMEVHVQGAKT